MSEEKKKPKKKKWLRRTLIIGACVLLFFVFLILLIPTIISSEFSEGIIEGQVKKYLPSSDLNIGDLSIGWGSDLYIDELSFSIDGEPVVELGNLSVPKNAKDLVTQKIETWDQVEISDLTIFVERNEDGTFNFDSLLKDLENLSSGSETKEDKTSTSSPINLADIKLNATNLSIQYNDKQLGHDFELKLDEWLVDWPKHNNPFTTDIAGFIRVDEEKLNWDLRGKVEKIFDQQGNLTIDQISSTISSDGMVNQNQITKSGFFIQNNGRDNAVVRVLLDAKELLPIAKLFTDQINELQMIGLIDTSIEANLENGQYLINFSNSMSELDLQFEDYKYSTETNGPLTAKASIVANDSLTSFGLITSNINYDFLTASTANQNEYTHEDLPDTEYTLIPQTLNLSADLKRGFELANIFLSDLPVQINEGELDASLNYRAEKYDLNIETKNLVIDSKLEQFPHTIYPQYTDIQIFARGNFEDNTLDLDEYTLQNHIIQTIGRATANISTQEVNFSNYITINPHDFVAEYYSEFEEYTCISGPLSISVLGLLSNNILNADVETYNSILVSDFNKIPLPERLLTESNITFNLNDQTYDVVSDINSEFVSLHVVANSNMEGYIEGFLSDKIIDHFTSPHQVDFNPVIFSTGFELNNEHLNLSPKIDSNRIITEVINELDLSIDSIVSLNLEDPKASFADYSLMSQGLVASEGFLGLNQYSNVTLAMVVDALPLTDYGVFPSNSTIGFSASGLVFEDRINFIEGTLTTSLEEMVYETINEQTGDYIGYQIAGLNTNSDFSLNNLDFDNPQTALINFDAEVQSDNIRDIETFDVSNTSLNISALGNLQNLILSNFVFNSELLFQENPYSLMLDLSDSYFSNGEQINTDIDLNISDFITMQSIGSFTLDQSQASLNLTLDQSNTAPNPESEYLNLANQILPEGQNLKAYVSLIYLPKITELAKSAQYQDILPLMKSNITWQAPEVNLSSFDQPIALRSTDFSLDAENNVSMMFNSDLIYQDEFEYSTSQNLDYNFKDDSLSLSSKGNHLSGETNHQFSTKLINTKSIQNFTDFSSFDISGNLNAFLELQEISDSIPDLTMNGNVETSVQASSNRNNISIKSSADYNIPQLKFSSLLETKGLQGSANLNTSVNRLQTFDKDLTANLNIESMRLNVPVIAQNYSGIKTNLTVSNDVIESQINIREFAEGSIGSTLRFAKNQNTIKGTGKVQLIDLNLAQFLPGFSLPSQKLSGIGSYSFPIPENINSLLSNFQTNLTLYEVTRPGLRSILELFESNTNSFQFLSAYSLLQLGSPESAALNIAYGLVSLTASLEVRGGLILPVTLMENLPLEELDLIENTDETNQVLALSKTLMQIILSNNVEEIRFQLQELTSEPEE